MSLPIESANRQSCSSRRKRHPYLGRTVRAAGGGNITLRISGALPRRIIGGAMDVPVFRESREAVTPAM